MHTLVGACMHWWCDARWRAVGAKPQLMGQREEQRFWRLWAAAAAAPACSAVAPAGRHAVYALAVGPTYPHTVPTAAPPLPPACLPPYPLLREAVGSKEGWQPSEFRSSRGMRAAVQQSVEQFLDDDELEDLRKTNLQVWIEWRAGHWWERQGGWLAGWLGGCYEVQKVRSSCRNAAHRPANRAEGSCSCGRQLLSDGRSPDRPCACCQLCCLLAPVSFPTAAYLSYSHQPHPLPSAAPGAGGCTKGWLSLPLNPSRALVNPPLRLQTTAEYDTFGSTAAELARRAAADAAAERPSGVWTVAADVAGDVAVDVAGASR